MTVLFCDLADSTVLAEQLDPEDLGELMLGYQELAREVVVRFGGTVAQFLGDGMLAYFGSPVAHEDDADRAVMSGLAILDGLVAHRERAKQLGADTFEARVAIHTGPVVVGSMGSPGRDDISLFGSTTNIAARLEGFASPGSVVVSETTVRVLRGRYSLNDSGTPELKGIKRAVRVWEVLAAVEAMGVRRTSGTETVIGRTTEIAALLHAVDLASTDGCQTVLLTGEPGVGKSTLLHALFDSLAKRPHRWLGFQCSELASGSPLQPVSAGIGRLVGIDRLDSASTKRVKLERALAVLGPRSDDVLPFIADLLNIDAGTEHVLAGLSPEVRRQHILDALVDWALALAEESPLVLVTEDLQWVDPTTLELIRRLADRGSKRPVALVATSRQGLPEVWQPTSYTEIPVTRLGPEDSRQLVVRLTAGLDLSPDTIAVLAERAGGVPLFIEELVRSACEGSDPSGELPETLQSVLAARLDRLGDSRSTAQAAAVLGREFSNRVLAAVLEVPEPELKSTLERLTAAGILTSGWSTEGPRYAFRHALIQDAAYSSLLRRRRRELHSKVCDVLMHSFPLEAQSSPELLAHHCLVAERVLDAAQWFTAAGRRAVERAALREAITHYQSGVQALRDVDSEPERDRLLLTLLILCANAFMGTAGPGGEDALPYWESAMALAEQLGDVEELTSAMNGAATYWSDRGRLDLTIEIADRILAIAHESESRVAALRGNCTLSLAYLMRGEGERSLHHSTTGIGLEEEGDFFTITYGVGHDEGVFARCMTSWALWWLGRPDASLTAAIEADRRAQALPSSLTQAMARHAVAFCHFLRGESGAATEAALQNVEFCEDLGVPFWLATALLVLGNQRAIEGDPRGLDDLDRAFTLLLDIGNENASSVGLAMLADAQQALGFPDQALLTVDAGLAAAQAVGQPFYEPELLRIKGVATAGLGTAPGEAANLFRESIASARAMGAASFQLRSSIGLACLPGHDPSSQAEVRSLLTVALAAMGDGTATAGQQMAQMLLSGAAIPSAPRNY